MDFENTFGPDIAREVLGHDADTRTLEAHHIQRTPVRDVVAVGVRTTYELFELSSQIGIWVNSLDQESIRADKRLTLNTLTPEALEHSYGPALNALCRKMAREDADYPFNESQEAQRRYNRMIRQAAPNELLSEAHEARQTPDTVSDRQDRKVLLDQASNFAKSIARRACLRMASTDQERQADDDVEENEEEFPEWEGFSQPDAEDGSEQGEVSVVVPIEEDDADDDVDEVPYAEAVNAMMQILLENSFSEHHFQKEQHYFCPLCLDDPTISEADKDKKWSKHKLERHLRTQIHSKYFEFRREAIRDAAEHPRHVFECKLCKEVLPEEQHVPEYNDIEKLLRHIDTSNSIRISGVPSKKSWSADAARRHEEAKEAIGWNEADFKGDLEFKEERKVKSRKYAKRASDIQWSKDIELQAPMPYESMPGWQHGAFDGEEVEQKFHGYLNSGSGWIQTEIPGALTFEEPAGMSTEKILEAGKGFLSRKRPKNF